MNVAPRLLAGVALALAALAAIAGEPRRSGADLSRVRLLATDVANQRDQVSALQLADWIHARLSGLRIIDLRSAVAFETAHIPTAERRAMNDLPDLRPGSGTVVVYGGEEAAAAWLLLREIGHDRVFLVPRGFAAWEDEVLHPVLDDQRLSPGELKRLADLSRYFGGAPTIGTGPHAIASETSVVPASTAIRVRSGGC
jgi:rhodanese-related sulfurtransferase